MQNNNQMAVNPDVIPPALGAPGLPMAMPSNAGMMMTGPPAPPQVPPQLAVPSGQQQLPLPPAPVIPAPSNESLPKQPESQMNIPASLPSTQTTQQLPMPPVNVPMSYPSNSKNIEFCLKKFHLIKIIFLIR